MTAELTQNPYAHLSTGKRVAKTTLKCLHAVLPRKVYEALYFPAFNIYHNSLRRSYGKQISRLEQSGNEAKLVRTKRVHAVMPHSLIGSSGLEHTHDLALYAIKNNIPGAFVECGVARGGCAALIATVAASDSQARNCWFFDSYEGLPDPTVEDIADGATGDHIRPLPKGSCLGTIEQVSELLFDQFKLSRENITLVKGWFDQTLPVTGEKIGAIALLRVDGDWYESTKCCLEELFDQVTPGGHVIIDDYYSCHGARKATDEFLATRGISVDLVSDGRGGSFFQKPVEGGSASDSVRGAA
ncbi:TylF/MycF/NovP-related O-methyltransferase [Adhaeretor mobilis]|uniref:Demethyldecarbamoylnovobiocin O-methyltransferase n=1 Tax=Adhaeretor mobilis TaxID=1930276 RepID=A0A517MY41_9BACT|nr:TylF/MycF/NovP-related O-methyltransferase [Adhaeretor mobilis]QDS99802.1 Demethyldecarbamoylnovobiocin O-methyltransferase [Adhaeretor mobilis]